MLTIRAEQMVVLRAHALDRFVDRAVRWMETAMPADFLRLTAGDAGEKPLRDLVLAAIHRAANYGIETEADVARYAAIAVHAGTPEFEGLEHLAWSRPILAQHDLDGRSKTAILWERLDPTRPTR